VIRIRNWLGAWVGTGASAWRSEWGATINENTFFILAALAAQPLHGYDVGKSVSGLSEGTVQLTVGNLHGTIRRLAAQGWIDHDRQETVNGRQRQYFRLNEQGAKELAAEVDRLRHQVTVGDAARTAYRKNAA
jgi:DNA-binding PadR family transcriptional regulator